MASISTNSLASSPYSSGGGFGTSSTPRTYYYSSAAPAEIFTHPQHHSIASDSGAPSSPAEISTTSSTVGANGEAPPKQYRTTTTTITTNSNGNNPLNERMDSYQPLPNTLHHSSTLQSKLQNYKCYFKLYLVQV